MCVSHLLWEFLHLPVLYQNHSSDSWWLLSRGFLGSCMISECNSIRVKYFTCSQIPVWDRGVQAWHNCALAYEGLRASSTFAPLWAEPRVGNRLLCHFNSSSSTQKLTRPGLPVFPRLNIHSHMKKKELEICVTVPSGDTWHPDLPLGKDCGSARQMLPPGPWFRRRETPVPPKAWLSLGILNSSLGSSNRRS